jgi:hypothetical protein
MKRLLILSAIAGLLVTMLSPSWAATKHDTAKNSISNIKREACKGKPDGTVVKVEGKNEKCPALAEPGSNSLLPLPPPPPATHTPESKPADRSQ